MILIKICRRFGNTEHYWNSNFLNSCYSQAGAWEQERNINDYS